MRIAIFQNNSAPGEPDRQRAALERAVTEISGQADVLITPELFMTGYNVGAGTVKALAEPQGGPFMTAACEIAARADMALIYGYPERIGDTVYNSAVAIDRTGKVRANYRKLHLWDDYEKAAFSPGDAVTVFDLDGVRIGLLICYDVEFPETVRAHARAGAELVVAPTALCKEWVHLTKMTIPSRALENGVFVAYANYAGIENDFDYCGNSCLIGPDGFDRARAGAGEEIIIGTIDLTDIKKARAKLPYLEEVRTDVLSGPHPK